MLDALSLFLSDNHGPSWVNSHHLILTLYLSSNLSLSGRAFYVDCAGLTP